MLRIVLAVLAAAQPIPRDSAYRRLLDFSTLVRGGRVTPRWLADGRSFWYVDDSAKPPAVRKFEPAANRMVEGFDTLSLVSGDSAASRAVPRANPVEYPSPNGRRFAFERSFNWWLRDAATGAETPLTSDGTSDHPWTRNPYYSRLIPPLWSPDGARLMAVRIDLGKLNRTTIVQWLKQDAEQVVLTPYPLTGMGVEQPQICILGVAQPDRVCLETGSEPDQVLYPLVWRSDGSEALVIKLDRFMKRISLLAANPVTGRSRLVVSDSQPTFVEGLGFVRENMAYPLADNRRFVWRSERDGWSRLYLYDYEGRQVAALSPPGWPVDRVVAIDERAGRIYFLGRGERERPYDVHLYGVDLEGRGLQRLTEATGEHDVVMSPDLSIFLDTHSTVERPPRTEVRRAAGGLIRVLASADVGALVALGWRAPREFTAKAADGKTDLYGALYLPADFDPKRRYPVIDHQYMGNFRQSAPHRFVTGFIGDESHALAQLGFVVFIVDGRGTAGRGKAFQDVTYGNIGAFEIGDHVAVLRELAATRPFMDTTRVGITGFSWGGYYTLRGLLTEPDVFKVGVVGAPVVDLNARANRIEPYMGTPQSNPAGYTRASNVLIADRLQGKMLLAIGTSDSNVTFSHSMRMVDALVKAGKHFDLIVLPGETHFLSPAALRYYRDARARFFVEHLKP